jgi:uncharacterized RDD family membrane protein YckC
MLERKGFGLRLGAMVIDNVIVIIAWQVLWKIFQPALPDNLLSLTNEQIYAWAERAGGRMNLILGLMGLSMAAVEILRAQTPGKMLLKLKIQSEAGTPAERIQLIRRAALKYGVYVFYVVGGILSTQGIVRVGQLISLVFLAGAFMALSGTKQALHDKLGQTAVFGRTKTAPASFPPVTAGHPGSAQHFMPPPMESPAVQRA